MKVREKIRLTVPKNLEWVSWVGSAVKGMAEVWGLQELRRFHLELAVVEAVTNAITHTKGDVELSFVQCDGGVRIEVWDDGRAVEDGIMQRFATLPDPDPEDSSTWSESGRGLFLIQETMSEVEFFRVGSKNCLSFLCSL